MQPLAIKHMQMETQMRGVSNLTRGQAENHELTLVRNSAPFGQPLKHVLKRSVNRSPNLLPGASFKHHAFLWLLLQRLMFHAYCGSAEAVHALSKMLAPEEKEDAKKMDSQGYFNIKPFERCVTRLHFLSPCKLPVASVAASRKPVLSEEASFRSNCVCIFCAVNS